MSTGTPPSSWVEENLAGGHPQRLLLWAVGLFLALIAHAGAILLAFREPGEVIAEAPSPPPAIMIELSPEAQAVDVTRNEITTETTSSVEMKAAPQPEPEPEPEIDQPLKPEVLNEPEPEPEVVTAPQVEPEAKPPIEVPRDAVPLLQRETEPKPEQKRKPPLRKPEKKPRRDPPALAPAPASRAAIAAAAEAATSDRNAANQAVAGVGAPTMSPATWQSKLMAHLERHKRYPAGARARGEQGVGQIRFTIDASGAVLSVALVRSSGSAELDAELVALAHRASPVPAPPPGIARTITAPVRFSFR